LAEGHRDWGSDGEKALERIGVIRTIAQRQTDAKVEACRPIAHTLAQHAPAEPELWAVLGVELIIKCAHTAAGAHRPHGGGVPPSGLVACVPRRKELRGALRGTLSCVVCRACQAERGKLAEAIRVGGAARQCRCLATISCNASSRKTTRDGLARVEEMLVGEAAGNVARCRYRRRSLNWSPIPATN